MDDASSVDSLIEEQAEVLNDLRKRRLIAMISRLQREYKQRENENSMSAIINAMVNEPDMIVDQLRSAELVPTRGTPAEAGTVSAGYGPSPVQPKQSRGCCG